VYYGQSTANAEASKQNYDVETFFLQTPGSQARITTCKRCDMKFHSRNKLHQHLRDCKVRPAKKDTPTKINHGDIITSAAYHGTPEIVYSEVPPEKAQGLGFRSWQYATIKASVTAIQDGIVLGDSEGKEEDIVTPNSGYTTSVIDREFRHKQASTAVIKHTPQPVRVRGIGNAYRSSSE